MYGKTMNIMCMYLYVQGVGLIALIVSHLKFWATLK